MGLNSGGLANGGYTSRRKLDTYPTPPSVTVALMEYLNLPPTVIWEPASGDGSMSIVLESYGHQVRSSDIRTGENIYGDEGIDFLTQNAPAYPLGAIITNPPFAESERFIRRALLYAPIVAMVLKSQYWHTAKRIELFRQHPPSLVLALTWRPDFMGGERGGAPTMDVLWTVWLPNYEYTKYDLLTKPKNLVLAAIR